ncbi:hypothetical protein, partial [Salmonella enterica]|uniref:hypothetical protein n=1 Tax=Salmonella enterica TaxID=28901 RepID=UPI0020C44D2A
DIEIEALLWEDMMSFHKKLGSKIPYVRYKKLLIQRALGLHPDIPQRLNDPDNHDMLTEPTLSVRIKESSTKKHGAVLPDH